MEKFKECPFCGNKNIIAGTDTEIEGLDEGEGSGYYAVVCNILNKGCGASGGYRKLKEDAIKVWNKRII